MGILDGVKFEEFEIQASNKSIKLNKPVYYKEGNASTLIFLANYKKVAQEMKIPGYEPVKPLPGKAIVGFCALQYLNINNLNPYCELDIMTLIKKKGERWDKNSTTMNTYIFHLPITDKDALDVGKVCGFPKLMSKITFSNDLNKRKCVCEADNETIIELELELPKTQQQQSSIQLIHNMKEGKILTSKLVIECKAGKNELRKAKGSYKLGNHPIADFIRSLKLMNKPLLVQYSTDMEILLYPPEEV
jgi:hypothetical protein